MTVLCANKIHLKRSGYPERLASAYAERTPTIPTQSTEMFQIPSWARASSKVSGVPLSVGP